MRKKTELFIENTVLGGYSIAVRDDWSLKIKRIHISETEKDAYLKEFGQMIILRSKFLSWWTDFNEINPSDEFLHSLGKFDKDKTDQ